MSFHKKRPRPTGLLLSPSGGYTIRKVPLMSWRRPPRAPPPLAAGGYYNGIKLASSALQQGLWPPDIINLHQLPPVLSSSSR